MVRKVPKKGVYFSPRDSLRALVHIEVKLGDNNIVISEHFAILKVFEVINQDYLEQISLE